MFYQRSGILRPFFFWGRPHTKKDSVMQTKVVYCVTSLLVMIPLLINTNLMVHTTDAPGAYHQTTNSYIFNPIADAYVTQLYPANNFGSNMSLRENGSPIKRSYLRFVVKGLNGSAIQFAKIR